jgi:RHS repeat-associated protein
MAMTLGRIQTNTASGVTETFLYSGSMLVGEYDSAGNVLARYVPGPGTDEAVVWYAGAGTTTPQWLHADPLGSTIAWSNSTGGAIGTQAYDPFGQPASWSGARFAYTGQLMLGEAQLYDYKARAYSPSLGRFMQTDPAGQASDLNPYAYVGNGPLGLTDPSGMVECFICTRVVAIGSAAATASDVGSSDPSSWADIPECEAGSPASSCQVIVRATPTGAPTTQLSFGDLPSFGGPNSGGGGDGQGAQRPQSPDHFECRPANSTLTRIADTADAISAGADVVVVVAGAAALGSSPTIVGGVTFGGVAVGAEFVSEGAGIVSVTANAFAGRWGNATLGLVGVALGAGSGPIKLVSPTVNYLRKAGLIGMSHAVGSLCS